MVRSTENAISTTRNVLLVLGDPPTSPALERVTERFCGAVVHARDGVVALDRATARRVYVCGDLSLLDETIGSVRVIEELSSGLAARPAGAELVRAGQVPRLVHGVGVLFPRLFDEEDLFDRVRAEHVFQQLTESTKASKALRTGIYLTDITRDTAPDGREILHHRLLRCSSNLSGPTDNLRETDRMILAAVNAAARDTFERETDLNHVLAQIYENRVEGSGRKKERKARISAHSDKTKDMRADGLIAFCTFYDPAGFGQLERSAPDPYDWRYKKRSGLTQLHFKLKGSAIGSGLAEAFTVTLYPNSVFIIPLSTNRLYTHAIRPSALNVDRIPTRMGYVVRSSKAEAQFMDGQTFLKEGGALIPLEPMSRQGLSDLRGDYFRENATASTVAYGEVRFSMNAGDYQRPNH